MRLAAVPALASDTDPRRRAPDQRDAEVAAQPEAVVSLQRHLAVLPHVLAVLLYVVALVGLLHVLVWLAPSGVDGERYVGPDGPDSAF